MATSTREGGLEMLQIMEGWTVMQLTLYIKCKRKECPPSVQPPPEQIGDACPLERFDLNSQHHGHRMEESEGRM